MLKKIVFIVFVISLNCAAFSAVIYNQWSGGAGTSDWNTPANWNLGYVPHILAPDQVNNVKAGCKTVTGPVLLTGQTADSFQFTLGGTGGGILTFNGGTLALADYLTMGANNTPTLENGTLVMNSGNLNITTTFFVGQKGQGTVNMSGGNITVGGNLTIADTVGSIGDVNLCGGTISAAALLMNRSGGATALMNIGGGILILNGDQTAAIDGFVSSGILIAYNGAGTIMKDYNITNLGKTTVWGYLAIPKATNPSPLNGATNLAANTTLSWTAGSGAVSRDVYFGTTSPGAFQGNQTATTFNPGELSYGTIYYWRIDEIDEANTVTTGDVWSFTTTAGQATNPSPANGATGVQINPTLSWTAAPGMVSHNVYFGSSNPPALIGNQTGTTYNPGTLTPNMTYYWRIDEVDGANMIVTGNVWSFTASQTKAFNPTPSNGATNVLLNQTLSWSPGATAVSHDVYFGTTSPGTFKGNQASTSYNPGNLSATTTYYWRIDEKDANGNTTTGDVWSFATGTPPAVYPYLSWRGDPNSSIVVNWFNTTTGDSSVDYGPTSSYGSTVYNATATNYHHVELTGLNPGATYHYRIRSSDGTFSSDYTFTTAPAQINSFSFVVYGDPRGQQTTYEPFYNRHQALCNWISQSAASFALETGDTVWGGCATVAYPHAAQGYYMDFYGLESGLASYKPIMATMGNHEVQPPDSGGTITYTYYYDLYQNAYPANGPSGNTGRVYSFNYGNAHFVCLSSFQLSDQTQGTWLDADLAAARANPAIKWIFAYMHYPMYTTSGHNGESSQLSELTYWLPLFDKYHVNIVFGGHNHCYERSKSLKNGAVVPDGNGTVYITNGLGGAEFNTTGATGNSSLFATLFGSEKSNCSTVATCITINGNFLTSTSILNGTGTVIDSFQLNQTIPGDFNNDGKVDTKDLKIFADNWLSTGIWP